MKNTNIYARYRYPPQIISHVVWLYHRFTLSFCDIEELLAAIGITVRRTHILQALTALIAVPSPNNNKAQLCSRQRSKICTFTNFLLFRVLVSVAGKKIGTAALSPTQRAPQLQPPTNFLQPNTSVKVRDQDYAADD